MQLVRVNARQHHVVMTDGDNGIAKLLLDLSILVSVLAGTDEFQLVDARRKVGNDRVDVVLADDKDIRAGACRSYCMCSGASRREHPHSDHR